MSRKVLAGLLRAGHVISCFLMRQMEYDADSYEIKLAGTASFIRASTRVNELSAGVQIGYRELSQLQALPVNLPRYFIEKSRQIPSDALDEIRQTQSVSTRAFDTHPSDADRLRVAERAAESGALVGGEELATCLFNDFDTLCAAATRHHYEHRLRLRLEPDSVVENHDVARATNERREHAAAMTEFFSGRVSVSRPLYLDVAELERVETAELQRRLADARAVMNATDARASGNHAAFEWYMRREHKAFSAKEVWQAGLMVPVANQFDLATGTLEDAQATQAWAREQMQALVPALDRFDAAASTRLGCALSLAIRRRDTADVAAIAVAFDALGRAMPHVLEMARALSAQHAICGPHPVAHPTPAMSLRLDPLNSQLATSIGRILEALGHVGDPLAPPDQPKTLAAWCGFTSDVLTVDEREVPPRVMTLYWTVLTRIVSIARTVEDVGEMG
jgi:hypothetical protein